MPATPEVRAVWEAEPTTVPDGKKGKTKPNTYRNLWYLIELHERETGGDATDNELKELSKPHGEKAFIASFMGVSSRLLDMEAMGFIVRSPEKRKDKHTGKQAHAWRVTNLLPTEGIEKVRRATITITPDDAIEMLVELRDCWKRDDAHGGAPRTTMSRKLENFLLERAEKETPAKKHKNGEAGETEPEVVEPQLRLLPPAPEPFALPPPPPPREQPALPPPPPNEPTVVRSSDGLILDL